ncbi:hypothetical protein [Streptomyces sp. GbtcB6]|nr:hypothetical protein [Streptomyces sp. GbtcB6]
MARFPGSVVTDETLRSFEDRGVETLTTARSRPVLPGAVRALRKPSARTA